MTKNAPPRPGKQPARRGQESTVCGRQRRARYLTAKYSELVAKHDDLKLLEIRRANAQKHERHHTPEHTYTNDASTRLLPSSTEPADTTGSQRSKRPLPKHDRVLAPHKPTSPRKQSRRLNGLRRPRPSCGPAIDSSASDPATGLAALVDYLDDREARRSPALKRDWSSSRAGNSNRPDGL